MSTLHVPKRIAQMSRSFRSTDLGARYMLAVAIVTLVAIFAAFALR
jgi:hypothetical protein